VRDATAAYDAHIEAEEAELIPLARELLPPEEIAAVGRAMARRRGVAPAGAQITLE
jgi:hypothetical protein